jgi:hypothetical protein
MLFKSILPQNKIGMLKIRILIIGSLVSLTINAQIKNECFTFRSPKCGEHEIGINLFSIQDFRRGRIDRNPSAQLGYPSGLLYKLHCKENALRIGLDYNYRKYNVEITGPMYYSIDKGYSSKMAFRIGYERNFGLSKLQPFIGGDLVLSFDQRNGISGGYGDIVFWYTEKSYNRTIGKIGASPLVGLKYFLNEQFSISLEMNVNISYYRQDNNGYRQEGLDVTFNPIRLLSINYHF